MHALVVDFDRLPSSLIGCYGAAWSDTPGFDRLACDGVTWDGCYTSTEFLLSTGWPLRFVQQTVRPLLASGVRVTHLSAGFSLHADQADGIERIGLDAELSGASDPAPAILAAATDWIVRNRPSGNSSTLTWISVPWELPQRVALPDGPLTASFLEEFSTPAAVRELLAEMLPAEADRLPQAGETLEWFAEWIEPLARLGLFVPDALPRSRVAAAIRRAAAMVRVSLLDIRLGQLREALTEAADRFEETLLVVFGRKGDLLRHHPLVQEGMPPLVEERIHAPLWMRGPGFDAGTRRGGLVSLDDLAATLNEWFRSPIAETADSLSLLDAEGRALDGRHEMLRLREGTSQSLRTADLHAVSRSISDEATDDIPIRLFLKPDDVWDLQDIAPQMPDVAEEVYRQFAGW